MSGISLSPRAMLTWWSIWLKAADLISTIYNGINEIIYDFSSDSAVAIEEYVNFSSNLLLAYFPGIIVAITNLETEGLPLLNFVSIVNKAKKNNRN